MKLGERGVVGREGGVRAMGNYKGRSFRVVLISLSEGFRGPLIIGSAHFKDFIALVLWGVGVVKTRISTGTKMTDSVIFT